MIFGVENKYINTYARGIARGSAISDNPSILCANFQVLFFAENCCTMSDGEKDFIEVESVSNNLQTESCNNNQFETEIVEMAFKIMTVTNHKPDHVIIMVANSTVSL